MATMGQILGRSFDMVENGELPRPSIRVYSGRGVWFLWLLVDDDGYPPRAFDERILTLETINRELSRRLAADVTCCDSQRMLRVPGSTNSKADAGHEIVEFHFLPELDRTGRCAEYTLKELAEWLGLETPKRKKSQPKIFSGWNALGHIGCRISVSSGRDEEDSMKGAATMRCGSTPIFFSTYPSTITLSSNTSAFWPRTDVDHLYLMPRSGPLCGNSRKSR
jgi:hypothetical protein